MKFRERLLNPKKLKIDLEKLSIVTIDDVSYRTFTKQYTHVYDGHCQCFKDCDCASRKETVTNTEITWYRNIIFDNTDKCFYSEPYTPELIIKSN